MDLLFRELVNSIMKFVVKVVAAKKTKQNNGL